MKFSNSPYQASVTDELHGLFLFLYTVTYYTDTSKKYIKIDYNLKQAGAELCQAQDSLSLSGLD